MYSFIRWIWFIFLSFINFLACTKVSKLCFKKCLVLFVLLNCLFRRKFISSKVKSVCTHIGIEFVISAVVLKIHARFTRAQIHYSTGKTYWNVCISFRHIYQAPSVIHRIENHFKYANKVANIVNGRKRKLAKVLSTGNKYEL